jgi:hypothetical protein
VCCGGRNLDFKVLNRTKSDRRRFDARAPMPKCIATTGKKGTTMTGKEGARLHRQFDRIGRAVPASTGFLAWIRKPSSRIVRIPLGILLILGGVFSFLPLLGVWMLPLGLFLLALDLPFLQGPLNRLSFWVQRKWTNWQRSRKNKQR